MSKPPAPLSIQPDDEDADTDLDSLSEYLLSDRSPAECMDLSELDGFLAGIAAGPEQIAAAEWLPVIWKGEEPCFEDADEARSVLSTIMSRYRDIELCLANDPLSFVPIFWEDDEGEPIVQGWAHGFMHAVSLRTESWEPVLRDEDSALMLIPIGIIAGQNMEDLDDDMAMPPEAMDELLRDADTMLAACVVGLHTWFRENPVPPTVRH